MHDAGSSVARCPRVGATYEGGDPALLERLLEVVDYIEVTPDSLAIGAGEDAAIVPAILEELHAAAEEVSVVAHGVGLSIGSASGWNTDYLRLLDELVEAVPLDWHSEHLAYTFVDGEPLGTMLTLPRTEEALELVCERVAELQRRYGIPFLLENVTRLLPDADGDYDEASFLNELCGRSGCGLVLDLYNLECDAHNHGFDIDGFIQALSLGAVHELHVAGGVELDGMKLDVHSRGVQASTVALAERAASVAPDVWGATYEVLKAAVPVLGHDTIVGEVTRLSAALS
ncbi:MAG TPA: DUF692 family protein [Solirubrobacteraceae bacterium]|jgi:uncharacterized protein (UPF0276 family)|nr:DUF692 family protein [Solirubrobacteraceae bacterium]